MFNATGILLKSLVYLIFKREFNVASIRTWSLLHLLKSCRNQNLPFLGRKGFCVFDFPLPWNICIEVLVVSIFIQINGASVQAVLPSEISCFKHDNSMNSRKTNNVIKRYSRKTNIVE